MAGVGDLLLGTTPSVSTTSQPTKNGGQLDALERLLQQLGGGSPVDIQDYFTKSVEEPMLFDFKNKILPMLQSTFSGSSAFGSDKLKQTELLTNNLTRNLTSSRADIAYKSESDAANRMMQALGLIPAAQAGSTAVTKAGQDPQNLQIVQLLQALGIQTMDPTTVVQPGSSGGLGGLAQTMTAMLMKGGSGTGSMFSGMGDWFSSLFSGAGGSADISGLLSSDAFMEG